MWDFSWRDMRKHPLTTPDRTPVKIQKKWFYQSPIRWINDYIMIPFPGVWVKYCIQEHRWFKGRYNRNSTLAWWITNKKTVSLEICVWPHGLENTLSPEVITPCGNLGKEDLVNFDNSRNFLSYFGCSQWEIPESYEGLIQDGNVIIPSQPQLHKMTLPQNKQADRQYSHFIII